ncbi:MAG: ParA family protein [Candidatus Geothermincolia bacterium]
MPADGTRIMAVANQKGGVGKSTTAVNLGAYLALEGKRVLLVDLDPQGNATSGLGIERRQITSCIYNALVGEASFDRIRLGTALEMLHVVPSTINLAGAEIELVAAMSRESRLKGRIAEVRGDYDFVLIDCPPSLGLLTINGLTAAEEVLVPIQCEFYALEGLVLLMRTIQQVRAHLNPDLRISGILMTMYDGRTNLSRQVVEEVVRLYPDQVFQTIVPRSIRLSEAPSFGQPIALYDGSSKGAVAYQELAKEVIANG